MKNNNHQPVPDDQPYVAPFIRRLMKDATEEEILEASENLRRYLNVLYDIFLRQEEERLRKQSRS
jgi:hypothetical protein